MRKIKTAVSVEEKEHNLKFQEIKKNSSADVLHTIKRIRAEETKIIVLMVCCILVVLFFSGYFIFSAIQGTDVEVNKSGPLVIEFSDDETGMSDIVNFDGEKDAATSDFVEVFSTEFTITNNNSSNSWYAVYLDDYLDMIEYDDCKEKSLDKNSIYFSIDNSEARSLASVYDDGRYSVMQGIVQSNDMVIHELQVWYSESEERHYHGKINVEYLR